MKKCTCPHPKVSDREIGVGFPEQVVEYFCARIDCMGLIKTAPLHEASAEVQKWAIQQAIVMGMQSETN